MGGLHVMIQRFDTAKFFRLIEQEKVQSWSLVPTMATALVNCPEWPKYDFQLESRGDWRRGVFTIIGAGGGGEVGCTCYAGYGLTETAPTLSVSKMKSGLGWEGEQRYVGQAMAGFAIPGVELRVVDANDVDVARDGEAIGEVIARGDSVMKGYWKQPEATRGSLARRLVPYR